MIYTCTLNPSIDYEMHIEKINIGKLNRSVHENYVPGGKGINVSILLNNINVENHLLGFIGGYTGSVIINKLCQYQNLKLDFVNIVNSTRINVKIKSDVETEINADGPQISSEEYKLLLEKITKINSTDVFVLSGSIPSSIPNDIYKEIAHIVSDKQALLVVDATKESLFSTLEFNPFLIKPNKAELEELFNVKITTFTEIIKYAKTLQNKGAINVLVSLGKDGAILVTKQNAYYAKAPIGIVKNTVGAGDSMVAGFMAEYLKSKSFEKALKHATACGSATAFSSVIGTQDEINDLIKEIEIHVLTEES